MDSAKKSIRKDIFRQINEISFLAESKTEKVITESDNNQGRIVKTANTVTRTYLYIIVNYKVAKEMADRYDFSTDQRKQLAELLSGKTYYAVWYYEIFKHRVS